MGGGKIDEEKIRNAKSKFADEIEADEYAKRRRNVIELEKMEDSQQSKKKKKDGENNRMTKTWFCKNCRQNYTIKPRSCIAAQHNVRTLFEVKEVATKDEQRNKLHKKRIEDGGLILGSGIDWKINGSRVGYNRFNN